MKWAKTEYVELKQLMNKYKKWIFDCVYFFSGTQYKFETSKRFDVNAKKSVRMSCYWNSGRPPINTQKISKETKKQNATQTKGSTNERNVKRIWEKKRKVSMCVKRQNKVPKWEHTTKILTTSNQQHKQNKSKNE